MEVDNTLSVFGLGKLGSSMLAGFASKGFNVIGVDVNQSFVDKINNGVSPIEEPEVQELIEKNRKRIFATTNPAFAIERSYASFIIVPTPSMDNGLFSIEYVVSAVKSIAESLREKNSYHLIVITSTVLPGDTEKLARAVEEVSGKKLSLDFGMCYNPEFIALGRVVRGFLCPDTVLIGQSDDMAGSILQTIHEELVENKPGIFRMNWYNAELAKISLNAYCTMKITFANVVAEICEHMPGGNACDVLKAIGSDTRIGRKYFRPGMAFAGPCVRPETPIQTDMGLKRIDQLEIGNCVLTHKGRYRKITKIYVRPYAGPLIKITAMGYPSKPLLTTPDHPIWGASRKFTGKKYRTVSTTGEHRLGYTAGFNEPEFIPAYKIEHADSILMPVLKLNPIPVPVLNFRAHYLSNLPARLELTPELLEFFGFYVSEGCSCKREINLTLHKKETVYADRMIQVIHKYFGAKARIKPHGKNGIRVRFHATHLVSYLKETFGRWANEKRAPWEWLALPEDHLVGLLRGMWYGDGSCSDGVFTYGTISPNLCRFIQLAFFRFGIPCNVREAPARKDKKGVSHQKAFFLRVENGNFFPKMNEMFPELAIKNVPKGSNLTWCDGSSLGFNVKSVSEEEYAGQVYNLEVEEDESYVLEWGTVHNCFPRDNRALSQVAKELGVTNLFCNTTDAINNYHKTDRICDLLMSLLDKKESKQLAILGLSYKEDTPSVDESVSIEVMKRLVSLGIKVTAYDPAAMNNAQKEFMGVKEVFFADSMETCLVGKSVCFVATPWPLFKSLTAEKIKAKMKENPVILDGWGILSIPSNCGIEMRKIGKNYEEKQWRS